MKLLQTLVGGRRVATLPYIGTKHPLPCQCYVHEDALHRENCVRNDLASGVLQLLGFSGVCAFAGTVVLTGIRLQGLTTLQQARITNAIDCV